MPALVRFARPGRRRLIDDLPSPPVSLRVPRDDDDLVAARGILAGVFLGTLLWIGILAWFIWR